MQYLRMGPTPWLRTSHPASVSIGDPQFPIWISSQGNAGLRSTLRSFQKWTLSDSPSLFMTRRVNSLVNPSSESFRRNSGFFFDADGTRVELMEANAVDGKATPSSTAVPPIKQG